jgi:hypothetical protein
MQVSFSERAETANILKFGCEVPKARGYGAAGACSSGGNGAGPLINGTAINGVVVALVGPDAVELPLLTTTAGPACCWPIATDNAPIATTPLAPITTASDVALLRFGARIVGTFLVFEGSPRHRGDR